MYFSLATVCTIKVLAATDADADEEGAIQTKSGSKHNQVSKMCSFVEALLKSSFTHSCIVINGKTQHLVLFRV